MEAYLNLMSAHLSVRMWRASQFTVRVSVSVQCLYSVYRIHSVVHRIQPSAAEPYCLCTTATNEEDYINLNSVLFFGPMKLI